MAGFGVANERLRALEELEREIGASLQSAGLVILELSKEKPQERHLDRQGGLGVTPGVPQVCPGVSRCDPGVSPGLVILELSKEKPQERHLDRQGGFWV
ncbi:mediator of RNA polymerase II transcription subunit 11 isoform X2 [Agelaius tricolor]|uniref:mediator of RNA polymerase II transcription subunit 11 isoform X2 n=1 Tax=Agelaius tricolor TaxID=9191 RepID=UPI0039F1DA70